MSAAPLPAADRDPAHAPGHWVLARAGKKVLRPGGKETTHWLLDQVDLRDKDVVEFAPGLGLTAKEILARNPRSYTGIDRDAAAVATARAAIGSRGTLREGEANATGLPDACADVVVAEAMLSMHTDTHKAEILAEAARILRPGGVLLSHELLLRPDDLAEETKTNIRRDIARAIHVNARPLTISEWAGLAAAQGLAVVDTYTTTMSLLEPRRVLADEGWRVPRIIFTVLRDSKLRAAVFGMRAAFRRHAHNLGAIGRVYTKVD
ncbi:SAM-dependent methyltransferase [Corynebacterium sp. 13CS0277]|uniref:methyltransferase domain-containing protein n=1 Tax=Corynebacterium sp. 13CS0277 TaxID=2071994 RepID=UPI000D039B9F|nr:methyltransferase domain-containing protein [Corynebacterium sp. 13CS0277]PRQ12547.1 SAM-dependent methyltransferase [Corynebacterium sp. 13CS0277]